MHVAKSSIRHIHLPKYKQMREKVFVTEENDKGQQVLSLDRNGKPMKAWIDVKGPVSSCVTISYAVVGETPSEKGPVLKVVCGMAYYVYERTWPFSRQGGRMRASNRMMFESDTRPLRKSEQNVVYILAPNGWKPGSWLSREVVKALYAHGTFGDSPMAVKRVTEFLRRTE